MFKRVFYIIYFVFLPLTMVCLLMLISGMVNIQGRYSFMPVLRGTQQSISIYREILILGFALLFFSYEFVFMREIKNLRRKLIKLVAERRSVFAAILVQTHQLIKIVERLPIYCLSIIFIILCVSVVFPSVVYISALFFLLYSFSVQMIAVFFLTNQIKKIHVP